MRIINFHFWLHFLLKVVSVIGQTVTVSIYEVGNDVVFHQQGSLNYFPREGSWVALDSTFDVNYFYYYDPIDEKSIENHYVRLQIGNQDVGYWKSPANYTWSHDCFDQGDGTFVNDPIALPQDTVGFQSIGFDTDPLTVFVASDYVLGEPMEGNFTMPNTALWELRLLQGKTCFFEYILSGELQRIEFVVGPPPKLTTAAPTISPTAAVPSNTPVVSGGTVTVSIYQDGNDVVFHQQGFLTYFPWEDTKSYSAYNTYDAGFNHSFFLGIEVDVENLGAWFPDGFAYNVSFRCLSIRSANKSEINLPEDTGGFQSVGFSDLPYIFVASDYIMGEPMAGNFTVPDTTLEQLFLVEGETCYFEFPVKNYDGSIEDQRIEFVVEPSAAPISGGTVTISIYQDGNDVVVRQQGSLNFLPSSTIKAEQSYGIGLFGSPDTGIVVDTGMHTEYSIPSNPPVYYECFKGIAGSLSSLLFPSPSETVGVYSIGFFNGSILVDSNYTLGATMSGGFIVPGTTLAKMNLVDGKVCSVEYAMNGEVQRLEIVVDKPSTTAPTTSQPSATPTVAPSVVTTSPVALPTTPSPTTAAPNTAAPTKSPTTAPISTPTISPTTMSPTTIAPTTAAPNTAAPTKSPTAAPIATTPTISPTTMSPTTIAPTTTAPNNAAPTKSPTAAPTTTPTISPTTMSPTTIAPLRERLSNAIRNIPLIGPLIDALTDFLNDFFN